MSLRQLAERDLGVILEDGVTGFGWPITVTDPDGTVAAMTGSSNDISQVIDPETGTMVNGRSASVVLRISSLAARGLGLPRGIADTGRKPWLIGFNDIGGAPYIFKVSTASPDRAAGVILCMLEAYK